MRAAVLFVSVIVLLLSCGKNRKIVRRIEGTWVLRKVLLNDGQHSYPNEIHVFGKEQSGGDSYGTWTRYSADYNDTTTGEYLVDKKGITVILRNESVTPVHADTCTVDDMDKGMLIIRSNLGVMYLYKK